MYVLCVYLVCVVKFFVFQGVPETDLFKGGPVFLECVQKLRFSGHIHKTSNAFISASFEDMNTL